MINKTHKKNEILSKQLKLRKISILINSLFQNYPEDDFEIKLKRLSAVNFLLNKFYKNIKLV